MTVTAISLTDPVSGLSVPILPAAGVAAQILDVAAPARGVLEDRVGAYGAYDTTARLSAGAVSLSLLLYPDVPYGGTYGATYAQTPEMFLDRIGPLLSPALRPVLVVTNDQWDQPRQITVRFDSKSAPLSDPTNLPVQISWVAPSAVWEASNLVQAFVVPFVASTTGLTITTTGLPITTAGLVMPAASSPSETMVTSEGAAPSQWTAFLYGPCTGPKFANDTAGLTLEFTDDVVLNPGDYVALDSLNQTANLNSDPSQPVLQFLSFATSSWWQIQPGLNLLRYYPSAAGAGAEAALSFRPAWYL